jgi:glycogen debranching enzyme
MPPDENSVTTTVPLPRLLPGEAFQKVENIPIYVPTEPPSSFRELLRLAQAKATEQIGEFGPPVAAIALERPGETISKELRKYEALFGRDSLRVSIDLLPMYPKLLRATLISLAELQGIEYHKGREEEPGRIIHEYRTADDPIAQALTRERGWEWPYYASVDATPQFVRAMYLYSRKTKEGEAIFRVTYTGLDQQTHTLGEAFRNAVDWILYRMSQNDEGLIEFKSPLPKGIENQVWRDSWDCYFHEDGTLANRHQGIASVEVQQLAFDAMLEAAEIYEELFDDPRMAAELRARAEDLREQILRLFWVDEKGGYFALGTDRDGDGNLRQLKIRTSNMGHLLRSKLLDGEQYRHYREALVWQLFSPEMLNVCGIRTLATDEVRFRPGAYHNGSVWLWDTYYCAEGLRHHGYYGLAANLADRIHMVINVTQRFPEYVRGDDSNFPVINPRTVDVWDENAGRVNRIEQPPQEVQAWTVAADIARDYYSGRLPERALDVKAASLEKAVFAVLNGEN